MSFRTLLLLLFLYHSHTLIISYSSNLICVACSHYCKIQDKDDDFYSQFNLVIAGLDSIEARRWINTTLGIIPSFLPLSLSLSLSLILSHQNKDYKSKM
jgi:hypothetical protein